MRSAAVLVAAAAVVLLVPAARASPRRLLLIRPRSAGHRPPLRRRVALRPVGAVLAAVATAVLLGGWPGLLLAPAIGALTYRLLARVDLHGEPDQSRALLHDLSFALDLLEACLLAGQHPAAAAGVIAEALGGEIGGRLAAVARAELLGAPPGLAWASLAEVAGGEAVARRVTRAMEGGSGLAPALSALAAQLRADRLAAGERAVRRAGVLVVLPLGLCFLPAFVCVGVVPVVVGFLGTTLR